MNTPDVHPIKKIKKGVWRRYVTTENGTLAPQADYKTRKSAEEAKQRWLGDSEHYRFIRNMFEGNHA